MNAFEKFIKEELTINLPEPEEDIEHMISYLQSLPDTQLDAHAKQADARRQKFLRSMQVASVLREIMQRLDYTRFHTGFKILESQLLHAEASHYVYRFKSDKGHADVSILLPKNGERLDVHNARFAPLGKGFVLDMRSITEYLRGYLFDV